jgi:hypothetical protein
MENVRLQHTPTGARITVDIGAFQLSRKYSTMQAAASEAQELGLISRRQLALLSGNDMVMPQGFGTTAERLDFDSLSEAGFKLSNSDS